MNLLNTTAIILHIPKEGVKKKDLIKEIIEMRGLSRKEVKLSIKFALDKKTIIKENDLIKWSPSLIFLE